MKQATSACLNVAAEETETLAAQPCTTAVGTLLAVTLG